MPHIEAQTVVAKATIHAPPGMRTQTDRVELVLAPDREAAAEPRYRWFRADDGSPTVVAGATVDQARRAAGFAWRAWDLQIEDQGSAASNPN